MKRLLILWAMLLTLLPALSQAQWSEEWSVRNKININPTALAGVTDAVAVPVRLHSGNFDFLNTNVDGSDIRFIAGDDKTELKFYLEKFDALNELAIAWVMLPAGSAAGEAPHIWVYSGNEAATAVSNAQSVVLPTTIGQFHFDQMALLQDSSATALAATGAIGTQPGGLIGNAANFTGSPITISSNPAVNLSNGVTWSAWVKPSALPQDATLFAMGEAMKLMVNQQTLQFVMDETVDVQGGNLLAATWQHIALTIDAAKATVYLNGAEVASTPIALPEETALDMVIGDGLTGEMDEMTISSKVLSPAMLQFAASSQGVDSQLLTVAADDGSEDGEGEHNYMGILIDSLTIDAQVVIVILAFMFAISTWVMWSKFSLVSKTDKDNKQFLERFQKATGHQLMDVGRGVTLPSSTLFGLYKAGMREVKKREKEDGSLELSGASMDAIRAAVDADLVRETQKMNALMVLLTIAISGGPFLGLLGTVVGVMITFAAIAAAGDVNVNAIAPGIAAALLATVAGLAVAIPALFGYNYLASRIKNITISMQIFVDEFITRIAELYGKE